MNTLQKQLLKMTRAECKNNKVKLYLGRGKSVRYSPKILTNGYFSPDPDYDDENPKLYCAIGKPNWELTLVHELNHMRQWIDNCSEWKAYVKVNGNVINEALSGKKINNKRFTKNIIVTLLMERDCEKRSYATLKELKYPQNKLDEYVQKANAYTIFYLDMLHNRKWYVIGQEPYNLKNVWGKFPKTFDVNIDLVYAKVGHLYKNCVKPGC